MNIKHSSHVLVPLILFSCNFGSEIKAGKHCSVPPVHVNVMVLRHLSFKGIIVTSLEGN